MEERIYIKDLENYTGKEVSVSGWVDIRRDQGKLVFIDFRDSTGFVQGVILPNHTEAMASAKDIRPEWVLEIKAIVNNRPEKNIQKDKQNGSIELEIISIKILNQAETPEIDVTTDGKEIGDEARLKYRYLDLRRPRIQQNLRMRHKVAKYVRDFLDKENFIEVETPILTKSTPEGARDFVVPSRLHKGLFYALPQSPQQYKQLLMTGGVERYFQIAKCMRDEDTRGDRQPEFTQIDMEMSFVTEKDIMDLNEKLLIQIVEKLYPEKRIQEIPFPRISYKESMEKYGNDRPDIREDKNDPNLLAFCWIIDFPFFEKTDKSDNPDTQGDWTFTHNPFSAPKENQIESLIKKENIGEILASQYDIVLNGYEIGGGSIRNHDKKALESVFEIIGHEKEDINKNFGHMLHALSSGTPPHGGIAWGFDRLMMLLQNEPNIREVIAFPKTGEGKDLMMDSPAQIKEEHLNELSISIKKPN